MDVIGKFSFSGHCLCCDLGERATPGRMVHSKQCLPTSEGWSWGRRAAGGSRLCGRSRVYAVAMSQVGPWFHLHQAEGLWYLEAQILDPGFGNWASLP